MMMREENGSILNDILVLDLADERGSFCSRLLADLGANVIKVERLQGDASRQIGPFHTPGPEGQPFSLSFLYNNLNKRSIALDLQTDEGNRIFERLVKRADVLVETPSPGAPEIPELNPADPGRMNPRLIHLSITPFGRKGPKQAYHSSDTVASASGGQMYVCRDSSGKPVRLCGTQSCYTASLYGAIAVLLQLIKRHTTGAGSFIDLSIQEAVASTLDHVMVDFFSNGRITKQPNSSPYDRNFAVLPCRDGHILMTILQNWETLIEILAGENSAGDLVEKEWREQRFREAHFDHVIEVVKGWTGLHTKQELYELGQAMRFPWAPVASPGEVMESPQLQFRRFFIDIAPFGKGPGTTIPGRPYRFSSFSLPAARPAPSPGEHTAQILEEFASVKENTTQNGPSLIRGDRCPNENILKGVRVLDLTRMLSGPYCTRILADFGADVIKVQTKKTALGAEQNDTAYFRTWNRNKRSITLDLDIPEARECFLKLAAVSGIVIENYSPRVMSNWGLTYDRLKEVNPPLIMLSLSAMGQTGPWKDHVGFGPTFHALSGLISLSSAAFHSPIHIGHAYGDSILGLYAAFAILAAMELRDKSGIGQHIDLSGYEALCSFLGPELMCGNGTRDSDSSDRYGQEFGMAVPDGCFPCKGPDHWCAITVGSDEQWRTFCQVTDSAELGSDRFSTTAGRKQNREELERLIACWTLRHSAEKIAGILQKTGLAASVVQNAGDIAEDAQLAARDFFISLLSIRRSET